MARSAPALHGHHNLPTHATALVGRDREVADLRQLLLSDDGRLVTLTGVGGCGKTRLALGVTSSLIDSFKDGVWLVELGALADPALVPQAVASVLGVRERSDRSLLDALVAFLLRRQGLLVLDNCEHLVQACAELAETLLRGCPGVRLLATGLSPREREVAALLAHGLSNRQIAERLVVTERTVAAHIEHILNKLGFASRHQVGVWANEHGLAG